MKTLVASFFILILSTNAWGNATRQQIQRAQEVLNRFVLPSHLPRMAPEKLNTFMKEVTYQELRPRDILRITEDIKEIYHRSGKSFIDHQHEGFCDRTGKTTLQKSEYFRIVQRFESNDTDWANKKDLSGVQAEYIDVLEFTAVKLDKNFEPVGDVFYLVARGNTSRKVQGVERFDGGFMSRNPSLNFSRSGVNDVVINAQAVTTEKGVIPAFSPAIIVKLERTRMKWTIANYDYVATLHLLNCPQQFRTQNCEIKITGIKSYSDPTWAVYTMPENRREVKFWGMTLVY